MKTDYELQQDVINELKWEPAVPKYLSSRSRRTSKRR